jgi:two-component system, OmpR family, copper resistance phosphate regulon response regulator CusR
MKILVIEDEPKVVAFLRQGLEEVQYEVDFAYDGLLGKKLALKNRYDILIIDINIPYINGFELCREIRKTKDVPILILTALGEVEDKLTGFEAGADDYLVKPFEFKELLARIKSLTRRAIADHSTFNVLKVADLELNLDQKNAKRGDKNIELTAKEFALLEYLMKNKNRVVSREDISEKVWDISFETGTNTIDVYVNFLRKKIDRDFDVKLIHTVFGSGYILKEEK